MDSIIQGIAIYALPVIFAITLHEAAHGYVAKHYGDLTAYAQGRVSLNPMRHIDLMGTIIVPLGLYVLGSTYLFGWAKPVPVNFGNLRRPKRDMLWVAAAGPGANLFMALLWALVFKLGLAIPESDFARPMKLMGEAYLVRTTLSYSNHATQVYILQAILASAPDQNSFRPAHENLSHEKQVNPVAGHGVQTIKTVLGCGWQ